MNKKTLLLVIILIASILRFLGLGFAPYHPDEHLVVNYAMAFGSGDMNPHMFYYPTFYLYQLFFLDGLFYVCGHAMGFFASSDAFLKAFILDPQTIYTLNRSLTAVYGVLTVWMAAKVGGYYAGRSAGLWASFLLALNFLHGRDSHFATVDIPMTFYMLCSFYYVMKALQKGARKELFCASFVAGLATSVKYNAFVLGFPIAFAAVTLGLSMTTILYPVLAFIAFFLGSPFFVIDFSHAIQFLIHLKQINAGFHIPWNYHLWVLGEGMGWAFLIFFVLGLFDKSINISKKIALVLFVAIYYVMVAKAGQSYERYIEPLIPFILLSTGAAISALSLKIKPGLSRKIFIGAVVGAAFFFSARSFYSTYLFLQKDTRLLAKEWIISHAPDQSVVILDDPMMSPRMLPSAQQIKLKVSQVASDPAAGRAKLKRLQTFLQIKPYPKPSYNLFYLSESGANGNFSLYGPMVEYQESAIDKIRGDYLVTNNLAQGRHPNFYQSLRGKWTPIVSFCAARKAGLLIAEDTWTYLPIDSLLWDYGRPGPNVTIYKRTE